MTSTLSGLKFVETKCVVKLRGDEWYSNLSRVNDQLSGDDDKIYFAPIFFRRWDFLPFHISDHLLAGKKQNIKAMFGECLKAIFEDRIPSYGEGALNSEKYVAESMLGRMYLETKKNFGGDHKAMFKDNFGIIELAGLAPYKLQANCAGRVWHSKFDDCDSITSMEEL